MIIIIMVKKISRPLLSLGLKVVHDSTTLYRTTTAATRTTKHMKVLINSTVKTRLMGEESFKKNNNFKVMLILILFTKISREASPGPP